MESLCQKKGLVGYDSMFMTPVLKVLKQEDCELKANSSYVSRLYLQN